MFLKYRTNLIKKLNFFTSLDMCHKYLISVLILGFMAGQAFAGDPVGPVHEAMDEFYKKVRDGNGSAEAAAQAAHETIGPALQNMRAPEQHRRIESSDEGIRPSAL